MAQEVKPSLDRFWAALIKRWQRDAAKSFIDRRPIATGITANAGSTLDQGRRLQSRDVRQGGRSGGRHRKGDDADRDPYRDGDGEEAYAARESEADQQ